MVCHGNAASPTGQNRNCLLNTEAKSHDARPPWRAKNPGYLIYRHHYGGMYQEYMATTSRPPPSPRAHTQRENAEHANTSTAFAHFSQTHRSLPTHHKRQGRRGPQAPHTLCHSATRHIIDPPPPSPAGVLPEQENQMLARGHKNKEKRAKTDKLPPTPISNALLFSRCPISPSLCFSISTLPPLTPPLQYHHLTLSPLPLDQIPLILPLVSTSLPTHHPRTSREKLTTLPSSSPVYTNCGIGAIHVIAASTFPPPSLFKST